MRSASRSRRHITIGQLMLAVAGLALTMPVVMHVVDAIGRSSPAEVLWYLFGACLAVATAAPFAARFVTTRRLRSRNDAGNVASATGFPTGGRVAAVLVVAVFAVMFGHWLRVEWEVSTRLWDRIAYYEEGRQACFGYIDRLEAQRNQAAKLLKRAEQSGDATQADILRNRIELIDTAVERFRQRAAEEAHWAGRCERESGFAWYGDVPLPGSYAY